MIYLNGISDHKIDDEGLIEHIVSLVEAKAAELENKNSQKQAS